MTRLVKKSAIALAVSTALAAPMGAQAGNIRLDRDGVGGTGQIFASTLVWAASNLLLQGLVHSRTTALGESATTAGDFTMYAQGTLGNFGSTACGSSLCPTVNQWQWTYQLGVTMTATPQTVSGTISTFSADRAAVASVNFFNIYAERLGQAGSVQSNDLTGLGFGADPNAVLVLHGEINQDSNTATDLSINQNDNAKKRLDNIGSSDNRPGIGTYTSNGNAQFDIHVLSQNTSFLITPLTNLTVGINFGTGLATPFSQVEPSAKVVGQTPNYGTDTKTGIFQSTTFGNSPNQTRVMDNLFCGTGRVGSTKTCDLHVQGQGLSAFFANVPEPATLALVGIGLAGVAFGRRTRRK